MFYFVAILPFLISIQVLYGQNSDSFELLDKWDDQINRYSGNPKEGVEFLDKALKNKKLNPFEKNYLLVKRVGLLNIVDLTKANAEFKTVELKQLKYGEHYFLATLYDCRSNYFFALGECDSMINSIEKTKKYTRNLSIPKKKKLELKRISIVSEINQMSCEGNIEGVIKELKNRHSALGDKEDVETYLFYLNTSGFANFQIGNYNEAIRYFEEAHEYSLHYAKNKLYAASALNSLSVVYYYKEGPKAAIPYYERAFEIYKTAPIDDAGLSCILNMTTVLIDENESDKALNYLLEYRDKALAIGKSEYVANLDRLCAKIYIEKRDFSKAKAHLDHALTFARRSQIIDEIIAVLDLFSTYYFETQDYKAAATALQEKFNLKDSIDKAKKESSIQKDLIEFESEKKESEIALLNAENTRKKTILIGITSVIFLLIVLFWIILTNQRRMNQLKLTLEASKLSRAQINPHFLNNAFTSIQASALKHGELDRLLNLTSGVARFTRLMLESSMKDSWSLEEEFELIQQYTSLYLDKYNELIHFTIKNELNVHEMKSISIPTALLQPLIENALEYAGRSEIEKFVMITIKQIDGAVEVQIANSFHLKAIPIVPKRKKNEYSRGLEITDQRIRFFNQLNKCKIQRSFTTNSNEAITTLIIKT
jgi:tetratricopeptide (TPR) repeat protein